MISTLTKLIQNNPKWLKSPDANLSFMKMSTPASGTRADKGKVLIFVFEEGETWPTLCVKTTRTYAAGESIRQNHDNLKALQKQVARTKFTEMFAKPLYLSDDEKLVFSVETALPGGKFSSQECGPELVLEKYIAWQTHLAKKNKGSQMLENNVALPTLSQHGDMTPDNVVVFGHEVYLVDYDYAGVCTLPGFDLRSFISKMKLPPEKEQAYYEKYFPKYFESIGVEISSYLSLFPHYHEAEVLRKASQL